MRFIYSGKPVLGFCDPGHRHARHNIHNVIQLAMNYPDVVTLYRYHDMEEKWRMV